MIDLYIQGLLTEMAESGFALPDPITPEGLRAMLDNPIAGPEIEIAELRDLFIKVDDRALPARLYHPMPGERLPIMLFFHGGGWVHGTLDMFDRLCAELAKQAGCAVLSVDYRLAPENAFPAAWDDSLAALNWVKDNGETLSVDPSQIALAGDSAGGNLAAATAQAVAGDAAIVHQLLFYPALDGHCASKSFNADHPGFLSADQMRWYWEQYAPGDLKSDVRVSPAHGAIKSGLAPATIIVAGNDPLHDEGLAYVDKLKAAGVEASLLSYPTAIHGFASLLGIVPIADEAVSKAAADLKTAFARA